MQYRVVAEHGRDLEDERAGISQRVPTSTAHAAREGAGVTMCGKPCTNWETFTDLQWPPGIGVDLCWGCVDGTTT